MTTGEYIKMLRESKGMTQEELGNKLGVKFSAVHKWESGLVVNLKKSTIQKLSEIFEVPPHNFIECDTNEQSKLSANAVKFAQIYDKLSPENKKKIDELVNLFYDAQ